MVGIVFFSIAEIFFYSMTYFYGKILIYSNISSIKQRMKISSQKQSIVDFMRPLQTVWLNMCCFKNREGFLHCNSTSTMISICNKHLKCTLSNSWLNHLFFPITIFRTFHYHRLNNILISKLFLHLLI